VADWRRQETSVDKVKRGSRQSRGIGIALNDFDVPQRLLGDVLPGAGELEGITIDAKDLTRCTDATAQRADDAHRTTTQVSASPAPLNANLIQPAFGFRLPNPRLQPQSLKLGSATGENIVSARIAHDTCLPQEIIILSFSRFGQKYTAHAVSAASWTRYRIERHRRETLFRVESRGVIVSLQTAAYGASFSLLPISAKVASPNRKRLLGLGGGRRSFGGPASIGKRVGAQLELDNERT
jgi:hypothetical protein